MATKPRTTKNGSAPAEPLTLDQTMGAILALMVAEREERLGRAKPDPSELVLADSGLDYGAISRVTGRPYSTVKSTVTRGREARAKAKLAKATS